MHGEDLYVAEWTNAHSEQDDFNPRVRRVGRDGKVRTVRRFQPRNGGGVNNSMPCSGIAINKLCRARGSGRRIGRSPRAPLLMFVSGALMLAALWIWPRHFYPLVWLSLVFLLDPINLWLGREHFLQHLRQGDWRIVVSLSLEALIGAWKNPKTEVRSPKEIRNSKSEG